tara:strand:- start:1389 stop:2765 length:1377 start_codon:yes stop_codon:yes gene_type:complete
MGAGSGKTAPIEAARSILNERVKNLRPSDEVMVIGAGKSPAILQRWTGNRHLLLEAISTLAPTNSPGNLTPAVDLAENLALPRENAQIVILSDGVISEATKPSSEVFMELITLPPPEVQNYGLVSFSARRSRLDPEVILIQAHLTQSATPTEGESPRLELRVNGQLTDLLPLSFDEGGKMEKFWRIPSKGSATIQASIQSDLPDSFPLDDQASLSIDAITSLPVYLVAPPHPFLEAALTSLDFVDASRISPEALPENPSDGLYIFHQVSPPPSFRPQAMLLIQPEGEGLWGVRQPGTTDENLITEWDEESDLLRHVSFDQVSFSELARYVPPPAATTFASSFESPILFGDWDGSQRWLATAFGLGQSDLVYRTVFPIFIGNVISSLSLSIVSDSASLPGETESRLEAHVDRFQIGESAEGSPPRAGVFSYFSIRTWLLLIAIAWTLLEWPLFHKRITE